MDTRTIFQISAIVSGSIFAFLLLIHLVTPALRGLGAVCWGFACSAIGLELVALRGQIPDLLSITAAQIFLILVNVFFYLGLIKLLQKHRHVLWLAIVSILPILTWSAWFTHVQPAQGPRIIAYGLILAFQNVLLGILVMRHGEPQTRNPRRCMAVLFYVWAAANLFNAGVELFAQHPPVFPVTVSLNAMLVLVPVLDSILTVIAFLWLSVSHLQYSLELQLHTDALTGLPDLRAIELTGKREIARARRAHSPLSTILIEFTSLQAAKARYGNEAGNLALSIAASYLTDCVRSIDLVARFGEDKFVIFLPETVREAATEVAFRLRQGVDNIVVRYQSEEFSIPVNFGVIELRDEDFSWKDLIRRADADLRQIRDEGSKPAVRR